MFVRCTCTASTAAWRCWYSHSGSNCSLKARTAASAIVSICAGRIRFADDEDGGRLAESTVDRCVAGAGREGRVPLLVRVGDSGECNDRDDGEREPDACPSWSPHTANVVAGDDLGMRHRTLGKTGLKVSPLCLGAMMFGGWGNPDHDDSISIIHAALDAGINFIDTADVYSAGESEEIVGKAIAGRRDEVVLATKFFAPMGDGPEPGRRLAPLDHEASARPACAGSAPTTSTCTRSTGPIPPMRRRRDARRAVRPRAPGQGPLPRQLDVAGVGDRRGPVGGRAARA